MVEPTTKPKERFKKIKDYYYSIDAAPLGWGSFGEVYKGFKIVDKKREYYAIKVISKAMLDGRDYMLQQEIDILKKIRGEYILKFIDEVETEDHAYIVTELCEDGDLKKKLETDKKLPETEALFILRQVAEAFIEVDKLQLTKKDSGEKLVLMHRDIKPANILFKNSRVCLADFGLSKFVSEITNAPNTKLVGSQYYKSPQVLKADGLYGPKCDVWSMGVVLYQMLHGEVPYTGQTEYVTFKQIEEKKLKFSPELKESTIDLLEKMLKVDETARISWKELIEHPALAGISLLKTSKVETEEDSKII